MVRVAFDPQIFCHQRFGGISRYACNLALGLHAHGNVEPKIIAPFHCNEYLEQLPAQLVQGIRLRGLEGLTAVAYGLSVLPAKWAVRRYQPQVFHNTYYFPISAPKGAVRVLTVHDMIHEKFPQYFAAGPVIRRWKASSVMAADHVICISENTRRDLLAAYDIAPERVSVTHLAGQMIEYPADDRPASEGGPYLLYVGSRASYKNFRGLLAAYAASQVLRENFRLLCFGGGGFSRAEQAALLAAGVQHSVQQLSGSDAELARCYRHAALFVCPSYYEGFGMTVLEAMALDCPVACSNTSSLPEVVGDAAETFDPESCESIRGALENVAASPSLTASLRRRGRLRSALFSWQRCALETLAVYRRAMSR